MPFHSCWQPKQFVVIRPNACLTPFTAIITHFAWMTFWEESDSSSKASLWLFILFLFFYTDCRYPVVIICSINTILSYYVHSSFKKKEKKRKGREKRKYWHISVWETIKRRSEESFHHLSHHSEAKGTELLWSWNTFIIKHWKHSQEMMLYSEKKKKCCVYDVNTSHIFSVSKAFRHLSDSNLKNQFESIWYTMPS